MKRGEDARNESAADEGREEYMSSVLYDLFIEWVKEGKPRRDG